MTSVEEWAAEEFEDAQLGDARRTRRLVALAEEIARRPAGTVTRACASSASREGAFRLLENSMVKPSAVRESTHAATAARCQGMGTVFVPVDTTSLNVTDRKQTKGLGGVGSWERGARGVLVTTALAVSEQGMPLGIAYQDMHVREARVKRRVGGQARCSADGLRWLDALQSCRGRFDEARVTPWFQIDRGGDCWQVLCYAANTDSLLTVRASHDRRLDGQLDRLWAAVEKTKVIATKRVELGPRPPVRRPRTLGGKRIHYLTPARQAHTARVRIRAVTVPLLISMPERRMETVSFNAVLVTEVGATDPFEWLLLTTHPIATKQDVLRVVTGYTYRWRIEDFHRVWKRGLCRVEDTQLRSRDAIYKWATILAAVATRAMRLTHLARETPTVDATTELTATELEALIALRNPRELGDAPPTLQQAVRWLADLGGYTGPWNGPPGVSVVSRGLKDVLVAARAFENRKKR